MIVFPANEVRPVVLDTNIVLDVLVFDDAATGWVKVALATKQLNWLATRPMRDELIRVLAYPLIMKRLLRGQSSAEEVLIQFDAQALIVDVASPARLRCSDPDDQKFIDLAVCHKATLLSKDKALLCLSKRLLALDVITLTANNLAP